MILEVMLFDAMLHARQIGKSGGGRESAIYPKARAAKDAVAF